MPPIRDDPRSKAVLLVRRRVTAHAKPLEAKKWRRLVEEGHSVPKETAERLELQEQIRTRDTRLAGEEAFLGRQVTRRVELIEGAMARLDRHRQARERVEIKDAQEMLARRSLQERLEVKAIRATIPEKLRTSEVREAQRMNKEMMTAAHEMHDMIQKAEKDGKYEAYHRRLEQFAATAAPTIVEAARLSLTHPRPRSASATCLASRSPSGSSGTGSPSHGGASRPVSRRSSACSLRNARSTSKLSNAFRLSSKASG